MGNCFGKRKINHSSNTRPRTSGVAQEGYRSSSKKLSHPLPPPPPRISTYAHRLPSPSEMIFSPHLKSFTFADLVNATRHFCPNYLLGEGGFGYVYKGWVDKETLAPVPSGSGMAVAVKKLKPEGFQGHKEWLSEITYLGKLHHPNLVNLIGFCSEGANRLLVYEFMARGSLENHLFRRGARPLPWALRIKIAVEAARGLAFLHASESRVIFRDFKSSNILLDMDYSAKLSDFGLAKAGPTGDQTHVSTRVLGTQGYAAPEYIATGRLTTKCDVFSFGVVLLEIISGRRAIDKRRVAEEQKLLEWVRPQLRDAKKLFRIMDSKLEGQYSRKGAYVVANLALQCCHPEARYRPNMSEVLPILEKVPNCKPERSMSHGHMHGHADQHGTSSVQWSPQGSGLMPHR